MVVLFFVALLLSVFWNIAYGGDGIFERIAGSFFIVVYASALMGALLSGN